ncbi:MAG: YtxH domain-containing protein [Saprospiraceae bacterium]|nr:YtxH domain-containing protein [Saprospiraceae bacterium]MBK8668004.1 YtxH domain-containing protein [Saprospiraceae bacterium]MBL0099592.1 YtxH domain-containing protein [Saprospiraceae bacterium]
MRTGKFLLGILGGIATGALLGVLFAPDKGIDTRKKIVKKANDFTGEAGMQLGELVSTVKGKMEALKEETNHMAENWKKKSEEVLADLKEVDKVKMN